MNIWLGKLDPKNHSIDDIEKKGKDLWKKVRHPKAMQYMAEVKKGDKILVYHSGEKAIRGVTSVLHNLPDPEHNRGRLIEVKFGKKFSEPYVTLEQIKSSGKFDDYGLVREPRLSFMPVPEKFIKEFGLKV
jgi:predicted RNA-binding protein with PUA-like domain